jgi:hypothetical protein
MSGTSRNNYTNNGDASGTNNAMPDSSSITQPANNPFPSSTPANNQSVSRCANSRAGSNVLIPEQNARHSSRIGVPQQESLIAQNNPMPL